MSWVLGVDSGGSGLRVALARSTGTGPGTVATAERGPVRTGTEGIDALHMAEQLLAVVGPLRAGAGAEGAPLDAVCVGAAGMATLGADLRAELPAFLRREFGTERLLLAADAVTAYAGAVGERPGAVVAAGTGLIALGTDLRTWRRADGWGHLLGDCGSGAWIGRAGLDAALRNHDGREGGSHALRARAEAVFGPLPELPSQLYPREDRAAVLASFAPEVAACADTDPVAERILEEAAREVSRAAAAACPPGGAGAAPAVALTGGLPRMGEPLLGPVRRELGRRLPAARLVEPAGDPLDGAVLLATRHAAASLALPADAALLQPFPASR
ncbi:N-acetylglucosamine kinase [Streptomyces sulphureus]|uniref:N-acetylglucosamine kinase n=1 Tax=Streptomyces sulphureus TaxID=47758 RepID=UPI000368616C|nr:BadF/BadG/BcrA/BcrD ATPase family protein [Streptomyces sulphureus]